MRFFCSGRQFLLSYEFVNRIFNGVLINRSEIFVDLLIKRGVRKLPHLHLTTPRTSCIYFLPKIHKPNDPGRPIVSACSCPTELISSYLDKIMAPIVKTLPSYIKDRQHALQIFRDFNFLGQDKLLLTMDITSLYTVIPKKENIGTQAIH